MQKHWMESCEFRIWIEIERNIGHFETPKPPPEAISPSNCFRQNTFALPFCHLILQLVTEQRTAREYAVREAFVNMCGADGI